MKFIKKYFLFVLLVGLLCANVFFILRTKNTDKQIEGIKGDIALTKAQHYLDNPYDPYYGVENCILDYEKKIENWPVYSDRKNCFSIQYPENWYHYAENNDPMFTISFDEQELTANNYSGAKATIEVQLDHVENGLAKSIIDATMLQNPETRSVDGTINIRLSGNFKDDIRNEWKYLDRVYIYRAYTQQVMTISYFENEYSEKNRELFSNMLATIKFGL